MIKLSDYVMRYVSRLGIKHVFMLPGGGCMHLVDSLGKNKNLVFVANLHEQASAICADAYSQYTGNLGAALVTTGPGGTNAITGVAASWIDSVPVLIISGQVKRADMLKGKGVRQMGPQEVDIVSLVKPVTKYAVTVMDPQAIKFHLDKAVYLAKEGRPGPVWIDIPLDVQGALINEKKLENFHQSKHSIRDKNLSQKITRLINLLNQSRRPVFLIGNGIRSKEGIGVFKKIAAKIGAPVLLTWRAADILEEDDPLYAGRPGSVGQRGANFTQQNADLIICIGARLDSGQSAFSYENFAKGAKKAIVDIDIHEIRKINTKIDIAFNLGAEEFLGAFLARIKAVKVDARAWLKTCREWKNKYPVVPQEYFRQKKPVNTYALVETLSQLLSAKDVIVPGSSGSCSEITLQAFKVKSGQRIFNSPGLGAMGFGLPASIGACFASGKKMVICLIGDGGLQHNLQELELLKRYKLPVKLFVLNNNAYASIRSTQNRYFNGRKVACDPSSGLSLPDTQKIAKAYGLKAVRINNQAEMKGKIKAVLKSSGPVLCEVMVDPDLATQPRVTSRVMPDGRMVSLPMEDLWPPLPRKEFKANMFRRL